ncbi:DUF3078 domain-containing protein [bacterium]|nr:DUF3078 domain-containing protein [candidate division CSSED10-310 bacterium]
MKLSKKYAGILICSILLSVCVSAQETAPSTETAEKGWQFSGAVTASGSFNQYKDWQEGGTDTSALGGQVDLEATCLKEHSEWKTNLKVEYGITKSDDEDTRKAVDKILLKSLYDYKFSHRVGVYARISADSAITESYKYYEDPVDAVFINSRDPESGKTKIKISDAFEPLNLEEGAGLSFLLFKNEDDSRKVTFLLGAAARQLVESNYFIESDDETTETLEFIKIDTYDDIGAEGGLDLTWKIMENARFTSNAMSFYGVDNEFWKVTWDSSLIINLGKYWGVSLSALMVYDELVFEDPQWKTTSLITLTYRLF